MSQFLRWHSGKESACQCRRLKRCFDPWIRKIPWSTKWQPTPVFFPGKFHGQRSLVGYSVHGLQRVRYDWAHAHTHTHTHTHRHVKVNLSSKEVRPDLGNDQHSYSYLAAPMSKWIAVQEFEMMLEFDWSFSGKTLSYRKIWDSVTLY